MSTTATRQQATPQTLATLKPFTTQGMTIYSATGQVFALLPDVPFSEVPAAMQKAQLIADALNAFEQASSAPQITNEDDFNAAVRALHEDTQRKAREIIFAVREDFADGWNGSEPVKFPPNPAGSNTFPEWERSADRIAFSAMWIIDRMRGTNDTNKRSLGARIRKFLGYNG